MLKKIQHSVVYLVLLSLSFAHAQPVINYEDFETGWGIWNDGGNRVDRIANSPLNNTFSIELRDNRGVNSSITTNNLDLTSYSSVDISFDFRTNSMDNVNEDFWLQFSNNGGATWTTIKAFILNTDFVNNVNYFNQKLSLDNGIYSFSVNSQFRIRCDASGNADYVYVDNILIEGNAPSSYCSSSGNNSDGYFTGIRQVTLNTINNSTPIEDNDYSDFTAISTTLIKGNSYNLDVSVNTDGNYTVHGFAWIDWNADGDFNDAGEAYDLGDVTNSTNGPLSTAVITVPETASSGSFRMRVSAKYDNNPTSCETGFDGEVEDYTITIPSTIDFDGVNDYVDFGDFHDVTGPFTLEAWVLSENNTGFKTILSKRNDRVDPGNNRGYHLALVNGNPNITWYNNLGTALVNLSSPYTLNTNFWYHIAATYNGSNVTLYIDGVQVATTPISTAPTNGVEPFLIGAMHDSSTPNTPKNYFEGAIDEVRIWNTSLTAQQIREMMNQEIELSGTNVMGSSILQTISSGLLWNNLVGYYPFNDNTANDFSGNVIKINGNPKNISGSQNQTAPLPYTSIADTNWDLASTWANGSEQLLPNTASVSGTVVDWNIVETNNNVNTTRNVTVLGLKVNSNELSINADNSLTVSNYLLLNGVLDLDGESQLIQSTGSILDTASSGYIERDQQGEGNRFRYNDWSSPVTLQGAGNTSTTPYNIGAIIRDGTNPASPASVLYTNGVNGNNSPFTLSTYWMYKYANNPEGSYSDWQPIGNTGNVFPGEGFLMKGVGNPGSPDQNYVFIGKPNNGTIQLTVSGGNDYLVGNPYPSAIDADQFIDDNLISTQSITGTLYFWEHYGGDTHNLSGYQAGYASYTKAGGVPASAGSIPGLDTGGTPSKTPGRYVPVAQGFFVLADPDGGQIEFNNGQRIFVTESPGVSVFMKNASSKSLNSNQDSRKKYRIGFDAPGIDHRQLLLTIDENSSFEIDKGYDAEIYELLTDDMYWLVDSKKMVIQAIPSVTTFSEIPLGIKTEQGGKVKIMVDALENMDTSTEVYIKDSKTGFVHPINSTFFEIELEPGDYNNRFSLTFRPDNALNVSNEELNQAVNVYMDNISKNISISVVNQIQLKEVTVYNYLGQSLIHSFINSKSTTSIIPFTSPSGVYLVKVKTNIGVVIKKVLVN